MPRPEAFRVNYPPLLESAIREVAALLQETYGVEPRGIALLLLSGDSDVIALVKEKEGQRWEVIERAVQTAGAGFEEPLNYILMKIYHQEADRLVEGLVPPVNKRPLDWAVRLGDWTIHPWPGLLILALVLLIGFYFLVGVLGAGVLAGLLEIRLFGDIINPWFNNMLSAYVPWLWMRDLLGGEYGLITMGIRYALALVLPVVAIFFMVFTFLEDSGYLPRLALLLDASFKKIGLNGRAVIPLVLGLGCGTMATLVSRTLETRRERFITILLLALAIPCSAQLGVFLAVLSSKPLALVLWCLVVLSIIALVGRLAALALPGERPDFFMEIPPLRLPSLSNILLKTLMRVKWYAWEVIPLFLAASLVIWLGRLTGLFEQILRVSYPLISAVGLPREAAPMLLYGFFRRDYGAAFLYDLAAQGALSGNQLVVAATVLTLFVPCTAQFAVMGKLSGWKTAIGMVIFIIPFSLMTGFALNHILLWLGLTF